MLLSYSGQCVIHDQTNYHTGSGDIIHIEGTVVTHQGGVDQDHDAPVGGRHVVLLLLPLR